MVSQSIESVQVINRSEFDLAMQRKALAKKKKTKSGSSSFDAVILSLAMISQQAFNAAVLHPNFVSQCGDGASWVMSHVLGSGASATVYLAHKLTDDVGYELPSLLAIKSAEIEHVDIYSDEEKMLRRVANINVVNYYGRLMSYFMNTNVKKMSNLFLEYCCGGSLATYIRDNGMLSEEFVQIFAHGILKGMQHINSKKIIYWDIKPDNILCSRVTTSSNPTGYIPKIADFGLSVQKDGPEYNSGVGHYRGTARYMSPELTKDIFLCYCTYVWAFGCSVLEMLTARRVWSEHGKTDTDALQILIGGSSLTPSIPGWLSDEVQDFLHQCLERCPVKRAKTETLLLHPFLNRNNQG